ncbi:uncharacterized protein LOC105261527 [Musca domestica]|uniref:Uncharacterized protein LOC105261527 n=1 Tax=Musca domestica TaxID=7370 RepID=A0A9J7D6B6_MUSDO|nr:uncharacterized protein LOC105261527 [Musca domestica]
MSLLERSSSSSNTNDYLLSSDELFLKELESRDGIYSFIYHELETTTTRNLEMTENDKSRGSCLLETSNCTGKQDHQQFIIYQIEEANTEDILTTPDGINIPENNISETTEKTTTNISTFSINNSISTETLQLKQTSSLELWKTWYPPFGLSPCRFAGQPQLFSKNNKDFRIRHATPRFSHITVPMVRNRRHRLKETSEYKKFPIEGYTPDLRSLFPHDPDVHAPFTGKIDVNEK